MSTAVLISKQARLLATAAHVVDLPDDNEAYLAVADGTATPYRVDRIWRHPGIFRELDGGLSARTDDLRDGPIDQLGPDVAVIQLAEGGPELPEPCTLADNGSLVTLDSRAMGILGYPSSRGQVRPRPERPAWATLAAGIFGGQAENADAHRLFVKHQVHWTSALLDEGSSGAPAFLTDGRVVGIIVGGSVASDGRTTSRCHRADLIRELLSHHHLDVPGLGAGADGELGLTWEPDPQLPLLREAVASIIRADRLRRSGDYNGAAQVCSKVIGSHGTYAYAYLQRSMAFRDYCEREWERLTIDRRLELSLRAQADSLRCTDLYTQRLLPFVVQVQNDLLVARARSNELAILEVLPRLDKLLDDRRIQPWLEAMVLDCRARYRVILGDKAGARDDFDEAIELDPKEPQWWEDRSRFLEQAGEHARAAEDRREAESLRAGEAKPGLRD